MRTLTMCLLLFALPLSSLQGAEPARAEEPPSYTATQMSRAVLAGVHVGLDRAVANGTVAASVEACVRAIDDDALAPLYQRLFRERITPEQIRELDAFYRSDLGQRYFRWSINQLRTQQNLPILDPVDFDTQAQERANAFHATEAGKALTAMSSPEDAAAANAINEAIAALLAPCR
ncbi:MAG: hypothetical protein ACOY82_18975 [Pseudomonadota bacterium]